MSLFKLHPIYLKQIRAVIREHRQVWFHGDGNMYITEQDSDTAATYFNPAQKEIGYRVKYTSVDQVPTTLDGLEKDLIASNQRELAQGRKDKQKETKDIGITLTEEDDFETEEVNLGEGTDRFGNEIEKKGPGRPKKS